MSDRKPITRRPDFFASLAKDSKPKTTASSEVVKPPKKRQRREATYPVSVYLPEATKRLVCAEAANANIAMSEFIRRLIDRRHNTEAGSKDLRASMTLVFERINDQESQLNALEEKVDRIGDLMLLSLQYAMFSADDSSASKPHEAKQRATEQLKTTVQAIRKRAEGGGSIWSSFFGEDS